MSNRNTLFGTVSGVVLIWSIALLPHASVFAQAVDPNPIGPPILEARDNPDWTGKPAPSQPVSTSKPNPLQRVNSPGVTAIRATTPTTLPAKITKSANFVPIIPKKDYSPPIILITQPRYDFGKRFKGEVVEHRFEVQNKGGAPLVLGKIKPSCGCTLVDESLIDRVISPGGKGYFSLRLETSRLPVGKAQKYADVPSNDPKQSKARVYIQGQIDALFTVSPKILKIFTVRGIGRQSMEITLTKSGDTDMRITEAKVQSTRLIVDLKEVEPGKLYKIGVKTNYTLNDKLAYYTEQIHLNVQLGETSMKQIIPVTVQIKERIEVAPRSLYFKRTDFDVLKKSNTPVVKTINIKSAIPAPHQFKITNLTMDDNPDSFFKMKVEPVEKNREYLLTVSVEKLPADEPAATGSPTLSRTRNKKGTIKITTDDPEMPEIVIRCIAFF